MPKKLSNIGIACKETPIDRAIEIFNTTEPQAMQFSPKTIEDMQKLATRLEKTAPATSIHLPNPQFNEITGMIKRKKEMIEMLKQNTPNSPGLITVHLGWEDADLVLDKQDSWKKTDLANKVASELADLFIAGIRAGKTITIENVRYKPHKHKFRECLGSKPEHLITARNKVAQVISSKTGMSVDEALSKIGYTFDVGNAVGNAHLSQRYSIKVWLQQLGGNIKLIHIHDVRPVIEDGIKIEKTHLPLGEGIIDWKSFFQLKDRYCPGVFMLLELTEKNIAKSVDYLEETKSACRP